MKYHYTCSVFYTEFTDLLKIYYFGGGMPEAVGRYAEDKDLNKVRNIQEEILSAYRGEAISWMQMGLCCQIIPGEYYYLILCFL